MAAQNQEILVVHVGLLLELASLLLDLLELAQLAIGLE